MYYYFALFSRIFFALLCFILILITFCVLSFAFFFLLHYRTGGDVRLGFRRHVDVRFGRGPVRNGFPQRRGRRQEHTGEDPAGRDEDQRFPEQELDGQSQRTVRSLRSGHDIRHKPTGEERGRVCRYKSSRVCCPNKCSSACLGDDFLQWDRKKSSTGTVFHPAYQDV